MHQSSEKILFILPYPLGRAPSQRFRVEMMLLLLDETKMTYTLRPFMSLQTWDVLYKGGSLTSKIIGIVSGYFKRIYTLIFEAPFHSQIFIHREAAPLGPPVFEWYLVKVLRKKIIYDFDDAIWIPNTSTENRLASFFKCSSKVSLICKWSSVISAGNDYLCNYASAHSEARVIKMPTVVDTNNRYIVSGPPTDRPVTIGWTGSHSTLKYLDIIIPTLKQLRQDTHFNFLVIADKKPFLDLEDWTFIQWKAETEITDLQKIDIGIMPLEADSWAEGKCGFKLIQYLSLGIPAVASPIGVNKQIIEQNINGFLCEEPSHWLRALKVLVSNKELRAAFGEAGRLKINEKFSIEGNKAKFLSLFD